MECNIKKYNISNYYRSILPKDAKEGFIYHSIFGSGFIGSSKLITTLNSLKSDEINFHIGQYNITKDLFDLLIKRKIFIKNRYNEDNIFLKSSKFEGYISHLRLCIAEGCNMNCSYCYMDCNNKEGLMPFAIAKRAVKEYYRILSKSGKSGRISFFGGEPLLNWECIEQTVKLAKKLDPSGKVFSSIYIATNGTLISKERARFISSANIYVSISLDGAETINDSVRKMKNGRGSYKYVIRGIENLQKAGYNNFTILCTVGEHNFEQLKDIISFTADRGLRLSINDAYAELKNRSRNVSDHKIATKFFEADIFARNKKLRLDGGWRWPFNNVFKECGSMSHCAACGHELSVDFNGDIKPCPGFDERYGTVFNIDDALSSPTFKKFSHRCIPNVIECRGCDIEGLCAGGCLLNASKKNGGNIFRKADNCIVHKKLFKKMINRYLADSNKPELVA